MVEFVRKRAWFVAVVGSLTFMLGSACSSDGTTPPGPAPVSTEDVGSGPESPSDGGGTDAGGQDTSQEELAERFNPALEAFRSDLQAYLAAYADYNSIDATSMSWSQAVKTLTETQDRLEERLSSLAEQHEEILNLVDAAIKYETIPEVAAGDARAEDVRRYVELWGLWIEKGQEGFDEIDSCVSMPQDEAAQCFAAYYSSPAFQEAIDLTEELNQLQLELFGPGPY